MPFPKKKILYVIPYFVPAWSYGGPVKVAFDFAKELTKLGNRVTVATTDVLDARSRNKKLFETVDGIKVCRFKNLNNIFARNLNFYTPVGFRKWLKTNIQNYDIVHIHEFFTYQSFITSKICHKAKKPYIIQPHGSLSQFCRKSRFYFIKNCLVKKFTPLVVSSSAIIALNEEEKKDIAQIYPQAKAKIKIAPNGLDLTEFKNIKKNDLHRTYNIPKSNKIIAFIGRLHFKKGLDISLKALARIKDELDFTFLIIGPDEGEKENLENLAENLGIKNRIVFAGLMSGNKKLETLKSADLSLLNSRSEGLPTTLLESAALALPIICSCGSNFPEVEQFEAGFVVDSTQQTAQKIKLVLKDDRLREKLSQNALKLADSFNLQKCTQTLNKIYESIS
ncbi:MAG: glycosyltransferase [Candidatus Berkelbacteria bacterium]|nr:glycosyltransferase [Candidatus Berkelbacteria bacterium]